MGEIHRTQGILENLSADRGVSPAAFSLSVHNSIGGLWSLIHGIEAPVLALAPRNCSPVPAIIEAAGLLEENPSSAVNIVYCEEDYPEFYLPWFDSPPAPLALALRLVNPSNSGPESALHFKLIKTNPGNNPVSWNSVVEFAGLLQGKAADLRIDEAACAWKMTRAI